MSCHLLGNQFSKPLTWDYYVDADAISIFSVWALHLLSSHLPFSATYVVVHMWLFLHVLSLSWHFSTFTTYFFTIVWRSIVILNGRQDVY